MKYVMKAWPPHGSQLNLEYCAPPQPGERKKKKTGNKLWPYFILMLIKGIMLQ